jgi:hypothetical protein
MTPGRGYVIIIYSWQRTGRCFAGTVNNVIVAPIKLTQEMTQKMILIWWGILSIGHFCRRLDKANVLGTGSITRLLRGLCISGPIKQIFQ